MTKWRKTLEGKAWKRAYLKQWLLTPAGKAYSIGKTERFYKKRQDILGKIKSRPCSDCKRVYEPCQMDFDHRPDEVKKFNIGNEYCRSLTSVIREIEKCDLVCANCHRLRTFTRGRNANKNSVSRHFNSNKLSAGSSTDEAIVHRSASL